MPDVRIVNVTKKYGKIYALDNISLTIQDKEYFSAWPKRMRKNNVAEACRGTN